MVTESDIGKAQEYLKKAYKLQMAGKLQDAVKNYKLSLEFYPTAEAHTYLGWTYSFLGKLDDAIAECKKAIDIDPEFGNPYNDIGAYLIQKGEYDEAVIWIELALKSKRYESYHFAHLNLGRIFELKGLWFEALAEYKKAMDLEPKYELATKLYYTLLGKMN